MMTVKARSPSRSVAPRTRARPVTLAHPGATCSVPNEDDSIVTPPALVRLRRPEAEGALLACEIDTEIVCRAPPATTSDPAAATCRALVRRCTRLGSCGVRRSALPPRSPVTFPSLSATTPFTSTTRIPSDSASGFSYVARSITVAVSKTAMSAAIPGAISPRSATPMIAAGSPLILRTAFSHVSTFVSRT